MGIWAGRTSKGVPTEVSIKWLIHRNACHQGMLEFLRHFPEGRMPLTEENFNKFNNAHQTWFRNAIHGALPWEEKAKVKQQALAKLTAAEIEALGLT